MAVTAIISDFDGVLSEYDVGKRLEVISSQTGLDKTEILNRIWTSGFEDLADTGGAGNAQEYLQDFGKRVDCPISPEDWLTARAAGMQHKPRMHSLLRQLASRYTIAMLTNNGPLMRDCFNELAPETKALFGNRTFFSCDFGTKKPDPAIFERVAGLIGVKPANCVFIDDKQRHVEGARTSGMKAIQFMDTDQLTCDLARLGVVAPAQ